MAVLREPSCRRRSMSAATAGRLPGRAEHDRRARRRPCSGSARTSGSCSAPRRPTSPTPRPRSTCPRTASPSSSPATARPRCSRRAARSTSTASSPARAQTLLARAQVILYRPDAATFRILVRPSFAPYCGRGSRTRTAASGPVERRGAREVRAHLDRRAAARDVRRLEDLDDVRGVLGAHPVGAALGDRLGEVGDGGDQSVPGYGSRRSGTGAYVRRRVVRSSGESKAASSAIQSDGVVAVQLEPALPARRRPRSSPSAARRRRPRARRRRPGSPAPGRGTRRRRGASARAGASSRTRRRGAPARTSRSGS